MLSLLDFALLSSDDFDLNKRVLGQTGHLDRAAGRIVAFGEESRVHLVHRAEVVHVAQEHGGLDNGIHAQAGGLQDRLDIGQGLLRLLLDALGERAGRGIDGQLAGSDDQCAQIDGLAVGADGCRCCAGADNALRKNTPPLLIFTYMIPKFAILCNRLRADTG